MTVVRRTMTKTISSLLMLMTIKEVGVKDDTIQLPHRVTPTLVTPLLTMHKTVINVHNILQPSFVDPFDVIGLVHLSTMPMP